ncbi:AMP-binding protein [Streptomyces sp. NPDC051162]|uniref:AMP-binding protein n=1 Tax=Streptomyces sp. NPDC051162 TaxID=3154747 RepID=UPI00343E0BFC
MTVATERFRSYVEENLDALGQEPDNEAVVHHDRRMTAGELRDLIYRMARALQAQGVRRGQTVTLLCGNIPETIAARYAANLLGCPVNHLYNKLSADVQANIVRDVETHALIVDPAYTGRAAELASRAPVPHVLVLGPTTVGLDLLALAGKESAEPFAGLAEPDDTCTIRHTGGTTGHPKAICSSFEQGRGINADWHDEDGIRALVCTTLAHAAGLVADRALGVVGGTVVLLDDFDAGAVLSTIEQERISHLFLLPPLLYQLMDHPDATRADTSSLRRLTYGGCPSSPARLANAVRYFGPVLNQFYGQNEAGGISMLEPEDHDPARPELLRSAGKIMDGVEVAIRDEQGRDLPHGEHGEICVRSSHVMQGYWKQPELTAEVLRNGWLHTGDVGYLDDAGYLTIVDRLKDMIVVVGGHVYTVELEDVLNSHPQVLQSAVFGVPDANLMEQVHAAVVRKPGSEVDEEELRAMVREERGAMYEPTRIVFVDALPLTDAGKPDKKLLRSQAGTVGAALG